MITLAELVTKLQEKEHRMKHHGDVVTYDEVCSLIVDVENLEASERYAETFDGQDLSDARTEGFKAAKRLIQKHVLEDPKLKTRGLMIAVMNDIKDDNE